MMPGQRAEDFVKQQASKNLPDCSCRNGVVPASLDALIPEFIANRLRDGLKGMDRKVRGWIDKGVMVGIETTTSAPGLRPLFIMT